MKKHFTWILIVTIGLALAGLVVVQSYWIRNAVSVREALFQQQVNNAMQMIVDVLQKEEAIHYILPTTQYSIIDKSGMKSKKLPAVAPLVLQGDVKTQSHPRMSVFPDDSMNAYKEMSRNKFAPSDSIIN